MTTALEPGDPLVTGPYQLVGRLGAGGMGQVFLGRSPGGRQVAVKVIRPELAGQPQFRQRFAQEVAAARTVSGLYTAPVVDADLDAPAPWLATAYVPGPSLESTVARYGPLPVSSVLALAAGLAEGLGAIHAAGIVHRDLKPSNVLLAADGPRVIDFGISRAADALPLTSTGTVVGSPGYMSPEQAQGQETGPPSDVFSLGGVLVFAAAGAGPFGTGPSVTLLYRVVHDQPALDAVPAPLRSLAERCLAKDPAARPTTAWLLSTMSAPTDPDWLPGSLGREVTMLSQPRPAVFPAMTTASALPSGPTAVPGPSLSESMPAVGPRRRRGGAKWPLAAGAVVVAAVAGATVATIAAGGRSQPQADVSTPTRSVPARSVATVTAAPTTRDPQAPALASARAPGASSPSAAATTSAPGAQATAFYWAAAVLSAHVQANAQAMVARLHDSGFDGQYWWSTAANSVLPGWWVVTSGHFADSADASALAQQLQAAGFAGAYPRCIGSRSECPA